MPRKAREKHTEAIYHIMCRSISEFLLFRDSDDMDYYLGILKKCIDKYKCSLYAYCLMDNHLHLHLDPRGFDISKFMQSLNTAYVLYYNKKYQRHGHVFQGRFESRILDSNEYNLAVSAYIHNNPHDIEGFSNKEETYKYSSYGIYLGIRADTLKLIDKSFIIGLFNTKGDANFVKKYFGFVSHQRDAGSFKQLQKELSTTTEYDYISGRTVILRNLSPAKAISFISEKLMISEKLGLLARYSKKPSDFRAFSAYILRVLCGLNYKDICRSIHNTTISGCSHLCSKGYSLLIGNNQIYSNLFDELIRYSA